MPIKQISKNPIRTFLNDFLGRGGVLVFGRAGERRQLFLDGFVLIPTFLHLALVRCHRDRAVPGIVQLGIESIQVREVTDPRVDPTMSESFRVLSRPRSVLEGRWHLHWCFWNLPLGLRCRLRGLHHEAGDGVEKHIYKQAKIMKIDKNYYNKYIFNRLFWYIYNMSQNFRVYIQHVTNIHGIYKFIRW